MSVLRAIRPTEREMQAFAASLDDDAFSYAEVGATRYGPPNGYFVDHYEAVIGSGAEDFKHACAALSQWRMFDTGWSFVLDRSAPQTGLNVAMAAGKLGVWTLNGCRVVYCIDAVEPSAQGECRRFGFAYGTLSSHIAQGEEVFQVKWQRSTNVVTYEISSFSWPNHVLAVCGLPLLRQFQRMFRLDSAKAMSKAVAEARVTDVPVASVNKVNSSAWAPKSVNTPSSLIGV